MQIGLRLHDAEKKPIEEVLPIVKGQGFKCVHMALSKSIREFSVDRGALTPGLAMYLKRLFWENQLDIAVLGCYLNLATPDEQELRSSVEKYKAHIRFASVLGCGVVGTETGAPNTAYRYEEKCRSGEALETFVKNLRPIVKYAESMGVIFAIEPVYKHIVYSPQRAREVLDEIDSPNLQIIFDPVNLLGADNCHEEARECIFKQAIELLGDDIAMVHLKDFVVQEGDLSALAPGLGNMDYRSVLRFIKERKPHIHVTLENTMPDNAAAARAHIENIFNKEQVRT